MKGRTRIPARNRRCAACDAVLLPGHEVYSVLHLQSFERTDLCVACFAARRVAESADRIFWRTRRPQPALGELRVDLDSVMQLFRRLLSDERPEVAGIRYLAALLLVRKRRLKLVDGAPDGNDLQILADTDQGTPTTVVVPAPDLAPESLAKLKEEFLGSLEWSD